MKYALIPVDAEGWRVRRGPWYARQYLDLHIRDGQVCATRWTDGNDWCPGQIFRTKESALHYLAWAIRLDGIKLAHEKQHEKALANRRDRVIHIPPWPKANL